MKKTVYLAVVSFLVIVLSIVVLVGCSIRESSPSNFNRMDITLDNHWEFLNISIVQVNQVKGYRLHIFPESENIIFENVLIMYSAYIDNTLISQTRVIQLSSTGVGQTMVCIRVFPIITGISGTIRIG
ncbi:MAG: hypothetical protein FWE45_03945 [Firmicutes bacterium]|nr:hypothetical protein [Bacillota bacterium]